MSEKVNNLNQDISSEETAEFKTKEVINEVKNIPVRPYNDWIPAASGLVSITAMAFLTMLLGHKHTPSTLVYLESNLEDVDAYINEEYIGQTPLEISLPRGKYEIYFEKRGFKAIRKDIVL